MSSPVDTFGFDLTTAAGYRWWRSAGGMWPDETPERMREYYAAQAASKAVDAEIAEREATDEAAE